MFYLKVEALISLTVKPSRHILTSPKSLPGCLMATSLEHLQQDRNSGPQSSIRERGNFPFGSHSNLHCLNVLLFTKALQRKENSSPPLRKVKEREKSHGKRRMYRHNMCLVQNSQPSLINQVSCTHPLISSTAPHGPQWALHPLILL